ncbi:MAG: hypothetical protein ACLRL6_09490 [Clostridium sp.]
MIWMTCILFLVVVLYYIFKEHASPFVSLAWKSASSACFVLVGFCAFAACVDRRYGEWMLIGLVSGAIGDVLLALPFCYPKRKNLFFLGGLLFSVRASRVCSCTLCHAGESGDSGRNMFNSAGIARD